MCDASNLVIWYVQEQSVLYFNGTMWVYVITKQCLAKIIGSFLYICHCLLLMKSYCSVCIMVTRKNRFEVKNVISLKNFVNAIQNAIQIVL